MGAREVAVSALATVYAVSADGSVDGGLDGQKQVGHTLDFVDDEPSGAILDERRGIAGRGDSLYPIVERDAVESVCRDVGGQGAFADLAGTVDCDDRGVQQCLRNGLGSRAWNQRERWI